MSRAQPSQIFPEHIGVRTVHYEDTKRQRPVVVELWYPTTLSEPLDDPKDPIWVHPQEIRNAPFEEKRHPLILMSHGHGGDRRDRSWIVEYLVKNGFIVASVEHFGNSWRNYNPLLTLRFWERALDISFAISSLIKDPVLKKQIDSSRIGFVGYSLGGMTGLALGGAKIRNIEEIAIQYFKKYQEIDKIDLEMVEKADFSEANRNFTDRRIKAFALLSPAAFGMAPESFRKIKAPVALVASEEDEVLPYQEHARKVVEYLKPVKLKLFREKVSHYVFLNRVSDVGKSSLRSDIQTENIQTDRFKIHKEVGLFLVAFFQEHLQ